MSRLGWGPGAAGGSRHFFRQVTHYLLRYATWIPPLIWFNAYVAEVTFIRGPSMYPFLNPQYNDSLRKDLCLVWKLYAQEGLRRGMVVTFRNPYDSDKITVKRIVGLEGDVVRTKSPYPPLPRGVMVLGFETANRTPSTPVSPSPSPAPDLNPAAVLDDGHTDNKAHRILSHVSVPTARTDEPPRAQQNMRSQDGDEAEARPPPFLHCMLAGGIGGSTGDMLMHSLDTVKTRQQGDPHIPPKYTSLGSSYLKIFRQEGIRRGLYGGWIPALAGSFPATCLFFGSYEWSKRQMLDSGVQPHVAYLLAGFVGDFAASTVYVPSEVVKTRLQLQGRYNNPYFSSGYNYRGTTDAVRTIVRTEGFSALFYGYGATLWRDLPFSALQFMFYEQAQTWAHQWKGSRDIGWELELLTGAAAGGLAGTMTCPLDVVKTRLQTQVHPPEGGGSVAAKPETAAPAPAREAHTTKSTTEAATQKLQKRLISTASPSTHTPKPGAITLETSSMITGLRLIYKSEGFAGWFRGVGPRAAWTSIQSGCMLFLYQSILRKLEAYMPMERRELV
ncbi:hypothetical protein N0V88_003079 [Collariella sp. IMI 366227]|nr:hypothetical protein N0V88_003079 [Collariella sp. IMI 366227]